MHSFTLGALSTAGEEVALAAAALAASEWRFPSTELRLNATVGGVDAVGLLLAMGLRCSSASLLWSFSCDNGGSVSVSEVLVSASAHQRMQGSLTPA